MTHHPSISPGQAESKIIKTIDEREISKVKDQVMYAKQTNITRQSSIEARHLIQISACFQNQFHEIRPDPRASPIYGWANLFTETMEIKEFGQLLVSESLVPATGMWT